MRDRNSPEYRQWRYQVLDNAGFLCEKCGNYATTVHHKIKWATERNFDPENGEALCEDCHTAIHEKERQQERLKNIVQPWAALRALTEILKLVAK